ncbi:MAG TPA: PH domain-containing protein [Jatrophihabitantaceae bacterium]|nr:PH domain-containing protein [Jatrophihabitantaceae bacterium]
MTGSETVDRVQAQPHVMARIGYISAAFVLIAFVVTAIVMPHANAGAHFGVKDQVATAFIGVILAGLCFMLTRPRLDADRDSVRMRSFLGNWRTVPWDVVVAVEFPSSVRFARLVLPGEETLALYAVQRLDGQRAVEVMRRLRALFAATR